MGPFRPVLVIFAGPSSVYKGQYSVSADVQVWRGDVCVTTVRILDLINTAGPDGFDPSCVEQFGSIIARMTARLCDEELFERINKRSVHTWHDLQTMFPAPSIHVQ